MKKYLAVKREAGFALVYDTVTKRFSAGCNTDLTTEQALEHWSNRPDTVACADSPDPCDYCVAIINRALLFTALIQSVQIADANGEITS